MKVLVTGSKGQLGFDVIKRLEFCGHTAIGVDIEEMDITDKASVERVITEVSPDAVIHCAAYTAVDNAEDNKELCRNINYTGTENIALVCKKLDIKLLYISTDYVFDGEGTRLWEPEDTPCPLNVYGETKLLGENAVRNNTVKYFIVRISWVFGINGKNFVKTMLRLGKERDSLTVVADQYGSPTYTYDLSKLLVDMIESEKYGIYHATNMGECSWYEFALEIFKLAKLDVKVKPVTSDEYVTKAKRPFNSRMNKDKLKDNGFNLLPSWQDALKRYIYDELENSVEG